MICAPTLNAVGAASAVLQTDCWGQEAAAELCREGLPLEGERLQKAVA